MVIEGWIGLQQVHPTTTPPSFGVSASKDYPIDAAMNNRHGTHWTRLLGNVKSTAVQAPVAHGFLGSREHQHFGMGGGILEGFHLIPSPGNDMAIVDYHRTHWHLIGTVGLLSLPQGEAHEVLVAGHVDLEIRIHGQELAHHTRH